MSDGDPTPPEDLPDDVAACLRSLDGHDLREAIVYARELLQARHEPFPDAEPGPGEEVVRVVEHEGYAEVHMRHRREDGTHGAVYVYHVTTEPGPEGERRHWSLIGRAEQRDGREDEGKGADEASEG